MGYKKYKNNPDEKIIGFFDVSTVSEKRTYFNYSDFYEGEPIPELPYSCEPTEHDQFSLGGCGTLIDGLLNDYITYHSGASNIQDTISLPNGEIIIDTIAVGSFFMVLKECGDCRELGTNVAPDFWEE